MDNDSLAKHAENFCAEVKSLEVPSLYSACFLFFFSPIASGHVVCLYSTM